MITTNSMEIERTNSYLEIMSENSQSVDAMQIEEKVENSL
jgi:hypothetical protein